MQKRKLSPKKLKTLNYYLAGNSQIESMIKAGYSETYANSFSHRLFSEEVFLSEMERRQALAAKRNDLDLDWAVAILKDIAEGDITDLYQFYSDGSFKLDLSKLDELPALKRVISGLETEEYMEGRGPGARPVKRIKIRSQDRIRAIDLIIRHLGLSKEKINVEGELVLTDRINQAKQRAGLD